MLPIQFYKPLKTQLNQLKNFTSYLFRINIIDKYQLIKRIMY